MIDLHAHSNASDGSDAPAELIARAARAGLDALALTDHDTIEGIGEAQLAADRHGVHLVPGCELSCTVEQGAMHLLVYFLSGHFVAGGPGPLQDRLAGLQAGRLTRNARIASTLTENGLPVTEEEIAAEAGTGSVGRPHIAAVLVRKGHVGSIQEAFDQWLAYGRPAYFARDRLTPAEAIALAHASGAVAVLAHPTTLGLEPPALEAFVGELTGLGLDGLECEYGRYTPDERASFRALAERFTLCPTGGSDYHGTYKPDLALGTGTGDLAVPDQLLTALEARAAGLRFG